MIGVVGGDSGAVTAALEAVGETPLVGTPDRVLEANPDAVVTIGRAAIASLVRDRPVPESPVLAVAAGEGFPDVGVATTPERGGPIADLAAGRYTTVEYPVLGVDVGAERLGNAVFDTMVVTRDPGRISEFRVVSETELGAVRADGVVVATPAGSHGYARSAGGPRLRGESGTAVVVPVGAFTMSPDRWVVGLDSPGELTSERDVPV
jgi:NAD+ kinase